MKEVLGIIEVAYSHFVLRDIFGKILPGCVFLFGIKPLFPEKGILDLFQHDDNKAVSASLWFLILGLAWNVGLALQFFGFWSKWTVGFQEDVNGWSKENKNGKGVGKGEDDWHDFEKQFHASSTQKVRRRAERHTVLKEACGILSVALFLLLALHLAHLLIQAFLFRAGGLCVPTSDLVRFDHLLLPYLIALGLAISLRGMHLKQANSEFTFMKFCILNPPRSTRKFRSDKKAE